VSCVAPLLFVGVCVVVKFNGVPLAVVLDPVSKLSDVFDPKSFSLYVTG
jgi:hypothetical protein